MQFIKYQESQAARRRVQLALVDATDGKTPELGENGNQPQYSSAGSNFVDTASTLVHVANGLYYVELSVGEASNLGPFCIRYKNTTTCEAKVLGLVSYLDPYAANLGLASLDAAISSRSTVSSADVLAQINAAINTAIAEPSPGAPPATPNMREAIITIYEGFVNLLLSSSTYIKFHNSAGTELFKTTLSQASGVLTRSKLGAP